MLHNKLRFALFVSVLFALPFGVCFAGDSNSTINKTGWDTGGNANNNSASNIILAGCATSNWNNTCRGTHDDEGAVVINMAREFNNNGGYFCPTQIQMGNSNGKSRIWVNFYKPGGADPTCKWICKAGYKGENCSTPDDGVLGNTNFTKLGQSAINDGSGAKLLNKTLEVFEKFEHTSNSNDRGASVTVLAIVAYYNHGVLVGRVKVSGTRDWGCIGGSCIKSWVTSVSAPTEKFLLCDEGYLPNSNRSDCVPASEVPKPRQMCDGWTEAEYAQHETEFEYREINGCYQYRCMDRNKAFPSAANRTCQDCSSGVRGGADRITGVCKVCALGQYFDENTNECKAAVGYSRTDLQYGKDKTKNNTPIVSNQCWTKTSPDEYKNCVAGITTTGGGTSNNNSGVGTGSLNFNRMQDISNATLQPATPSSNILEQRRR